MDFLIASMSPVSNNFSIQFLMNKFDVWIGGGGGSLQEKENILLYILLYKHTEN